MSQTPPWQVDDWTLSAGLEKIEQQWDALSEVLGHSGLFELRDPEVSGWSCGEHAGHMAMVTLGIAKGIHGNLAEPDRDAAGEWGEPTKRVLEMGGFPRGVAKSPPRLDTAGRPRSDFAPILDDAVDAWAAVRARAAEFPGVRRAFPTLRSAI